MMITSWALLQKPSEQFVPSLPVPDSLPVYLYLYLMSQLPVLRDLKSYSHKEHAPSHSHQSLALLPPGYVTR